MVVNINLQNYKNKHDDVEHIFDDDKRRSVDLLKIKRLYKKDDVYLLNKFLKQLASGKKDYGSGHHSVGVSKSYNQLCMAKMRYGFSKVAHLKFISLYMPQKNKANVLEKPELFGDDIEEYKEHAVGQHFKFIISPENQNVDLQQLTKSFVKQFNELYGFDVRYLAVQHNDTGHKHVHLVINGVDKNGKEINRIPHGFIKHTMREILSRDCTIQVGKRTQEDIAIYKSKDAERLRVTKLDEAIKMQMFNSKNIFYPYKISTLNADLQKRLAFLEKINLAKKIGSTYFLKPDWYETLNTTGRYNVFLSVKNEYAHAGKPVKLFTEKDNSVLKGTVRKIYNMDDEKIWQNGLVLETNNAIYYIPSYKKINAKLLNKEIELSSHAKNLEIKLATNGKTTTRVN